MKPIQEAVEEAFEEMSRAIRPRDSGIGTFGAGPSMHAEAKAAAPLWLQKWDDDYRWLLAFSNPERFFTYADAFGYSKEKMLSVFEEYREKHPDT